MVELSKEEQLYYSRQIMMDEIGAKGQLKLKKSKVCVVGLGGLGSPIAMTRSILNRTSISSRLRSCWRFMDAIMQPASPFSLAPKRIL